MFMLVYSFVLYHYTTLDIDAIIDDINANDYFDDDETTAKVIDMLPQVIEHIKTVS